MRLRPTVESDLPRLLAWDNDPEITRWAGKRFDRSDEARDWYLSSGNLQRRTFAIELNDGRLIGETEVFNISWRLHTAEMRIFIGEKDLWGLGLGEEAVRALVCGLFRTTKLSQVFLRVDAGNHRAKRCYAKVGFRPRGRVCFGSDQDKPLCLVLMTLDRQDLGVTATLPVP